MQMIKEFDGIMPEIDESVFQAYGITLFLEVMNML